MTMNFKSFLPGILLIFILAASGGLMLNAAKTDSAIMDELAHIPAGYSYIKYFDFRLNPEHPPFLKALAAVPLLGLNLNFPLAHKSWAQDINGQWEAGNEFIYMLGNNADQIIFNARIFPIILTLITTLLIFIWAKELLGKWRALIPTALFGLSPIVLAHGHYVTTDIAAAFGVVFSTYLFLKFLFKPTPKNIIFAGLALGVAQLCKFSLVLLIPYFIVLVLIFIFLGTRTKSRWYYIRSLIFIFLIALVVIYLVYLALTFNYPIEKQINDTKTILASFTPRILANFVVTLASNNLTRPLAEYLLGLLMVLQRASGGNTVYFLGEVSAAGSRWYFPLVFLMKETIPALILIISALLFGIFRFFKNVLSSPFRNLKNYLGTRFAEFSILLFVVIYWANSIKSNLNIGVRHLLPTLPFIYILTASGLNARKNVLKSFVLILLIWQVTEVALVSPRFLSYFNKFFGGTAYGYRYVTDSNYDWGQDLKRLKNWVDGRNNDNDPDNDISKIAVDYFGGGNPKYYLGDLEENWWSSGGNPKNEGIEWLAVSVNTLEGAFGKLHPGQQRSSQDEYSWLKENRIMMPGLGSIPAPDFKIGTSLFVYHFQ